MTTATRWFAACWICVAALFVSGCASKEDGASIGADAGGSGESAAGDADEQQEIEKALAGLSEEDRALAEKQKTCPVSGALLGTMDTPPKVTVEGRDVFLCCAGCEGPLKEDPKKYLAKLDAQ